MFHIFFTCFNHHKVQRVVPDVGDSSNVVNGNSQDELLSVSPHELDVVRRQANDGVLLWCQLARQLMALLRNILVQKQSRIVQVKGAQKEETNPSKG